MLPVTLVTPRLVLDPPAEADIDAITLHCQDPLFEHVLTTPWPYERAHAERFVRVVVPGGWEISAEFTWAIRLPGAPEIAGMISVRTERSEIGFWLGARYRRHGYMTEAVVAVADWWFARGNTELSWECVAGNTGSAGVARSAGFAYTGTEPSHIAFRDGSHPPSWHGVLRREDPRTPRSGWPAETLP